MPTNSPDYWSKNWWANYKKYHWSKKAKKQRSARNKARAWAMKAWKVKKGDKKHVDHIKPLSKGGSTSKSNTRIISAKSNQRAWAKIANSKRNRKKKYAKRTTNKRKK